MKFSLSTNWINRRVAGLKDTQPQLYSALMAGWDNAQNSMKDFANQFEPKLDSIISGGGDFISVADYRSWLRAGVRPKFLLCPRVDAY